MKKFIGLLLVLCLINFLSGLGGGGADQPDFPNIYIEAGVGGTHVGSIANPYDDFSDINWDGGGDNDVSVAVAGNEDVVIHLMEGDEWREQLTIGTSGSAAHPIIIRSYGSDVKPIINGADVISTWEEYADTLNPTPSASDDDGYIKETTSTVINNAPDFWMGLVNAEQMSGHTRLTLNVPQGATISAAYITITTNGTNADGAEVDIYAHDVDNASQITDLAGWTTALAAKTIATTNWNWPATDIGTPYQSPSIVDVVKEIVDRGGWSSGNSILLLLDSSVSTEKFMGEQMDEGTNPPVLHIEYIASNVWQAACAVAEPNQVFFDGTKGVNDETPDAEFDWYWDANVLYCYAATDPDGRYTKVEASVRARTIYLEGKANITIEDLELKYSNSTIINFNDASNNFIIDNCNVHHGGAGGITVWATTAQITNGSIKNCNIHDNVTSGVFVGHDDPAVTGITIENNTIFDNGTTPTLDHGIYLGNSDNNTIRYNLLANNIANGAQFQYGSDGNEFYYNLVYGNGQDGLWLGTDDGASNCEIYNNIFYDHDSFGVHVGVGATSSGNIIKNNIVYQTDAGGYQPCIRFDDAASAQGQTLDNNCYYYPNSDDPGDIIEINGGNYTLTEWKAYTGNPDPNAISTDPHFIDAANDDFRLLMASLCIDAGVDVGLLTDYLGIGIRHAPDIGAYENQTNAVFMARLLKYLKEKNKN